MFKRKDIRYHTTWIRLVCGFAVGVGIARLLEAGALAPFEELLRVLLVAEDAEYFVYLPLRTELWIVFAASVLPAVPRFERPVTMISFATGLGVAYLALMFGLLIGWGVIIPLASSLSTLVASTALLESMAWSEERIRRRQLENIETVRQEFSDMLVHDLRKRMSSILMSLAVLRKRVAVDDENVELLATIGASADRMLTLVDSLLDIRKMEQGVLVLKRERTPQETLVAPAVDEHRAAAGLAGLTLAVAERSDASVRVDRSIFSRVMSNLLWNALLHAPAGTEIETGYEDRQAQGEAIVFVANRGEPIAIADQEAVFQPFVSGDGAQRATSADTMGLGLTFCRLAVEAHGGGIEIESPWQHHGDGVRVVIRLPLDT